MGRVGVALGAALAMLGFVLPSSAGAAETRLVVGFAPGASPSVEVASLTSAGDAGASVPIEQLNARVISVPSGQAGAVIKRLRALKLVDYVVTDVKMKAFWAPNDPQLGEQWALGKVGAASAWDVGRGSASAMVAVVDTGVESSHPDLAGRVVAGRDFVDGDLNPTDLNGHGTHVAGIIAATADNGRGVAGLAPEAKVLAVRVLDASGSGSLSNVASGVVYAADQGAKVINLSLGASAGAAPLKDAIDYAASKGAVVACATGNDSRGSISYPAAYDSCFAVGATTETDARAPFSNFGAGIDVTAPGTNILATYKGGTYRKLSGTSMATPMVAGLAGLLAARGQTRDQIIATITGTAKDLGTAGRDNTFGWGRIDAAKALGAATPTTPVTPPSTTTPTTPVTPTPPTTTPTTPPPTTTPTTPNNAPICAKVVATLVNVKTMSALLRCIDLEGSPIGDFQLASAAPAKGTLSLAANGQMTYTAPAGYKGTVKFTYTASDGTTRSAPAEVSITLK